MKPLTVAFLYNVRHVYPDPNNPRTQLETDFDDPETIRLIIKHLESCGYAVIPIEANETAYFELYRRKVEIDIAFNYAEGIYGKDREAHIPAMLEMLQIPYTGSAPMTQGIVLNKAKTKEILIANEIPTLPFQVFRTGNEPLRKSLKFPLIVKPLSQGSSAGIVNKSVVNDYNALQRQVEWVISTFSQPTLVEPFITGHDLSIAMLGNPPQILPIIESDHSVLPRGYKPIDSLEVKWYLEEETTGEDLLVCPAEISADLQRKVETICYHTWDALEIRDWCRIDIRCDEHDNPYVLEVNSPAGILPPEISTTSYFPLAARTAGMDYDALLREIIEVAMARYGINNSCAGSLTSYTNSRSIW
jgi:D-alanine-D-alanine ligase